MENEQDSEFNMSATEVEVDDFLAHYGVKGMQWGKRRPVGPSGLINKQNTAAKGKTFRAKRTEKRDASNKRLVSGKGKLRDKARVASTFRTTDIARAVASRQGLGKTVAERSIAKSKKTNTRLAAVVSGKASKRGKAQVLLSTSARDVAVGLVTKQKVSAVTAKKLQGKRYGDK